MQKINIKQWLKSRLPIALFVIILWSIARESGVNFSIRSVPGIILTFCCILALVIEFYKSGDRNEVSFVWDTGLSVMATIIGTVILTLQMSKGGFFKMFLTDGVVAFLIIIDAVFSPYNSFRIALRNLMYDGTPGAGHDIAQGAHDGGGIGHPGS
jgi:hypothetical protein